MGWGFPLPPSPWAASHTAWYVGEVQLLLHATAGSIQEQGVTKKPQVQQKLRTPSGLFPRLVGVTSALFPSIAFIFFLS